MSGVLPTLPAPDFAGLGQPLLRAFRSIAILVERAPDSDLINPDVDALTDWIARWDSWFRNALGAVRDGGLHLQYRRDAVVVTDLDVAGLLATRPIGRACQDTGIGFGASILLSDALVHRDDVLAVLNEGWLQSLTLVHDLPFGSTDALGPFVEAAFATDQQIRLAGNPAAFLRDGVLDSPVLNARNVTIDPRSSSRPDDLPVRRLPCLPLMRVYIDSTGYLYPCLGMLGLEAGCLGHIDDPLEDTVLGGRASSLDWAALAVAGPELTPDERPVRDLGLPVICERHRGAIQAASAS